MKKRIGTCANCKVKMCIPDVKFHWKCSSCGTWNLKEKVKA